MFKRLTLLFVFLLAILIGACAVYFYTKAPKKTITVKESQINRIETMAQLCSVEIYSEIPVLDTINNKVMFAVQKQKGSVSFDVDHLRADTIGDTIRLTLPSEIVELYEATDPNSWEVIDTKAIGPMAFLRSDKFSDTEENALKARIRTNSKRLLYRNGTIARARREGAENLRDLMEKVYHKPVIVTDPTPNGAHYNDYK